MNLLVLMTTHNREAQAIVSIEALSVAATKAGFLPTLYLANSGNCLLSLAHLEQVMRVRQIKTAGETFWGRGMSLAWESSLQEKGAYDFVLWLNDDVLLDPDAIATLHGLLEGRESSVVAVGSCRSNDGSISYGGLKRTNRFLPLHLRQMGELGDVSEADAINGNAVLTSFLTHSLLGGFPRKYTHLRADIDFGLKAVKMGYLNLVTKQPIATCDRSETYMSYKLLRGMPLAQKLAEINKPKFGPMKEHIYFALKHGGLLGPVYAIAPIVRSLLAR